MVWYLRLNTEECQIYPLPSITRISLWYSSILNSYKILTCKSKSKPGLPSALVAPTAGTSLSCEMNLLERTACFWKIVLEKLLRDLTMFLSVYSVCIDLPKNARGTKSAAVFLPYLNGWNKTHELLKHMLTVSWILPLYSLTLHLWSLMISPMV